MRRQADKFLVAVPSHPRERYHGRGVIITASSESRFPGLYVAIRALRHVGCRLPIQVWNSGRTGTMSAKQRAVLSPFQVECVDADTFRGRHAAGQFDGSELKLVAILESRFEEVLFLEAHCYPCRNPEFLFELEDYRTQGAVFWPDVDGIGSRLEWSAFGLAKPRRWGAVGSDQLLIHKRQSWQPLNLARFYHDNFDYYHRYCRGRQQLFEVAWTHCGCPFVTWEPRSRAIDAGCLQNGPDHLPLFVNRSNDPFSFENHRPITARHDEHPLRCSAPPLERECGEWMMRLARHMGQARALSQIMALKTLAPCRWRKVSADGTLHCYSEKFVASPNRVVADTCRTCHCVDHESAPDHQAHKAIPLDLETVAPYCVYEPTRAQPRSKSAIAIATLYTPEIAELGLVTSGVMRAYAERHGYTAIVARSLLDPSRHPFWSKLVLVEHYLSNNPSCKWVMWMDADAVITNPEKRLEDFLERGVDFVIAEDPYSPVNSGVFLARNCAATIYVLRRAYAKTHLLPHELAEQMAVAEALFDSRATVNTRLVSRRLLNSFAGEHEKGDFIIHYAGWPAERKLAAAKKAIASAVAMVPDLFRTKKGKR
jgi:hypothetical protein